VRRATLHLWLAVYDRAAHQHVDRNERARANQIRICSRIMISRESIDGLMCGTTVRALFASSVGFRRLGAS
jgi:hypothetical protein